MFNQITPAIVSRAPINVLGAALPHLYWRIFCIDNFITSNGSDDSYAATRIEFRTERGGDNVAVGGTPQASSTYPGYPIDRAFDGDDGSLWSGDNFYNPSQTGWVSYQFTTPVVINEILWRARNDGFHTQSVRSGRLEFSDNGLAWKPAWSFLNADQYGSGGIHIFTKPS